MNQLPWSQDQLTIERGVVLGIGPFGARAVQRLADVLPPDREQRVALLVADGGGIHADTAVTEDDVAPVWEAEEPAAWLASHAEQFRPIIQSALRPLLRSRLAGESAEIDIYLVADLTNAASRHLWPHILELVRAATLDILDRTFTLILATDAQRWLAVAADERAELSEHLRQLEQRLATAATTGEVAGRIGWCYLIDKHDTAVGPLFSVHAHEPDDVVQLDHTVEFLRTLLLGLQAQPRYRATSLAHISADLGRSASRPWIASFAAASCSFPSDALLTYARTRAVANVISSKLLGPPQPSDRPRALKMRAQWFDRAMLSRQTLQARMQTVAAEGRHLFEIEPPNVAGVDDEALLDTIENWDTLLWQRWEGETAPPSLLEQQVDVEVDTAGQALADIVDEQLVGVVGGHRVADHFVNEAQAIVADEATVVIEAPMRRHWLSHLLGTIERRGEANVLPNTKRAEKRLRRRLRGRMVARAVWFRAAALIAILGLFGHPLIPALQAVYPWATGLEPLLARVSLFAASVVLVIGLSALQLAWSEFRIHRATETVIALIRKKYVVMQRLAVADAVTHTYQGLQQRIQAVAESITQHQHVLEGAHEQAQAAATHPIVTTLATEQLLIGPHEWTSWLPPVTEVDHDRWAEAFVQLSAENGVAVDSADTLLHHLKTFITTQTTQWRLTLADWQRADKANRQTEQLLAPLLATVHPAMPLGRNERYPSANQRYQPSASRAAVPGIAQQWIAAPEATTTGETAHLMTLSDVGRLAYVPLLHGIDLQRSRLWDVLQRDEETMTQSESHLLEAVAQSTRQTQ